MKFKLSMADTGPADPAHLEQTSAPDSVIRPVQRVQLFFPPMVFSRFQSRQTAMFPLGLGYIAAVLDRGGYDVSIVDCPSEGYNTIIDIGKERDVYGLTMDEIRQRIIDYKPQAIGLSVLFSTLENRALMIARAAKEIDPNIVVVCGGPHVSAFYKRLSQDPAVDYCVRGEGEQVILDLFAALNNGGSGLEDVQAICRRQGGQVHVHRRREWIENLDTVPFPARHLVDTEVYHRIGKVQGLRRDGEQVTRIEQMTTSRGCPFKCTYCGKNATWGSGYRTRSAENVLDEIEYLVEHHGIQRFAFQDDNFTADMDRAARIFDGIIERGLPITWEAHNGLGVNFLSADLLEKMKRSGCVGFTIAVESSNDATLLRVKKPNYIKLAPPIVKKAKELGIEVRGFFMIGFPDETLPEVMRTVEYASNLDLAVTAFALVTPLPGTQLYNECVDAGMIDEHTVDFEDFSFGAFELQLSKVPVAELKAIRKVEWLKTVLVDRGTGGLKADVNMRPQDILDELANGLHLFPDQEDLGRLHREAVQRYGPRLGMVPA